MEANLDDVVAQQPIVLDNGSGVIKAGFAGEDVPKTVYPAYVGKPKHRRVMAGAAEGDTFVGTNAEKLRGLLTLTYPMKHGVCEDWLAMEALWGHMYTEMKLNSEEHPILLTEAPLNPRKNRERAAELFFETFNIPALFVSAQAILALYASGRTTGVVLDSGDGVTHSVPVYEGFALSHAITRMDIAGRDVTEHLQLQLRRAGYALHTSAEKDIIREIKESACYVAFNPQKEESTEHDKCAPAYPFVLPDGSQILLGPERFRSPELLFHPSLAGAEYGGCHDVLVSSIQRADLDLRKTLYSQIVLSGGSTLFPGFGDRLLNEVRRMAPKDIKIRISAPPERKFSTWLGGSVLASLATFKRLWVTKAEYEDEGPSLLHRKTF